MCNAQSSRAGPLEVSTHRRRDRAVRNMCCGVGSIQKVERVSSREVRDLVWTREDRQLSGPTVPAPFRFAGSAAG